MVPTLFFSAALYRLSHLSHLLGVPPSPVHPNTHPQVGLLARSLPSCDSLASYLRFHRLGAMVPPQESSLSNNARISLNWKCTDIDGEFSVPIDWEALRLYALTVKRQRDRSQNLTCGLSREYNIGGLHAVRRIDFSDGCRWVARLQLQKPTPESCQRLLQEVNTMAVVRSQSRIPLPTVFAYQANCYHAVGVAFMLMEFIPGNTAMDSFGGWDKHKGKMPSRFEKKLHAALADIQVQLSSIRFPKIGAIECVNGRYQVGPIPGLGGPFDSAADYFTAWAKKAKFPYNEKVIQERTPTDLAPGVISSIRQFPAKLTQLAQRIPFHEDPFPLIHTDLYISNVIIDSECNVLSVIDWENAIVAPWEVVEFTKELSIVPPAMDGPLYRQTSETMAMEAARKEYINWVRKAERSRQADEKVSEVLSDHNMQSLAHAIWLYVDGRIGFYCRVLDDLANSLE